MEVCRGTVKDPVIRFENVSKEYPFYQSMASGFKSFIFNLPKNLRTLKKKRFTALDKVSFEVEKGETLGIIGRNGSGKSTILSIIAGVIRQDSGYVYTRGRISSLLELGAGFHPDLSGIENIILNGILMGNTKREMLKKIEEIVDFSELGDFIYQPLRTYSSGMYIRLGFSVAIHIEPDILLVDEAIAVGDVRFQEKCLTKIKEFREKGITTIIVSHDMSSIIELCDRVIWIDNGRVEKAGRPDVVVQEYLNSLDERSHPSLSSLEESLLDLDAKKSNLESRSISWWESGLILDIIERSIIGDEYKDFYQYLKDKFHIQGLNGIGVLNKLKHLNNELVRKGICKSFKTIDENDICRETRDFYDLFILIDFFGNRDNKKIPIGKIHELLKDGGFFIALDAINTTSITDEEREILSMIVKTLGFNGKALEVMELSTGKENIIENLRPFFDIIDTRYFGSILYDHILEKLINEEGFDKEILIKLIISLEQILLKKGILRGIYGIVIARKKKGGK
jgi:lipopolysaccharide transport system ATP-binding protein